MTAHADVVAVAVAGTATGTAAGTAKATVPLPFPIALASAGSDAIIRVKSPAAADTVAHAIAYAVAHAGTHTGAHAGTGTDTHADAHADTHADTVAVVHALEPPQGGPPMTHRCLPLLACAVLPAALLAAGCASVAPPAGLAGEHSAHVTADVARGAQPATQSAVIPVEHIFELSNPGPDPVVIVSHRTRINTVWHFEDTGTGALPRTIAPGETLRVAVTAKVRGPETQRFYVELHLSTGDVERLDLVVDG